tara:strand:+ start:250 stop:558 length:309 start_codon:yes stop_codon:yes gene_type:complete
MSISLEQHNAFKKMIDNAPDKKIGNKESKAEICFNIQYDLITRMPIYHRIRGMPSKLIMIPESLHSSSDSFSDSSKELFEFKYDPNIKDEYDVDIYDFESYI